MKRHYTSRSKILLLFLLLAVAGAAEAQTHEFAPIGAEWHYTFNLGAGHGYVHIASVTDTVIDGMGCRKLEKSYHIHDGILNTYSDYVFGYEYVTLQQNAVMLYKRGAFYTLFDFDAEEGDSWTIPQNDMVYGGEADTVGTVVVVGKGTEEVNGVSLRYIEIMDGEGSQCGFCYHGYGPIKVIERVGPVNSYLFPEQTVAVDFHEGGILRCYFDEVIGLFKTGDVDCDYITAIDENHNETMPHVYPNPTKGEFAVTLSEQEPSVIEVFDALGKRIYKSPEVMGKHTINLSLYPNGMFLIRIQNGSTTRSVLINKL